MTDKLSGLEVEYAVVLLASSQAGKREAVLHFDVGNGTADLEHRNERPVLFQIRPALPLNLRITDVNGSPSMARLEFRDEQVPAPLLYLLQWLNRWSQSRDDLDDELFRME